jgi:hypothetical protein
MITLLFSLLLMAAPCETGAFCRCVLITREAAMERAGAVFTATVVSVRSLPPGEPGAPAAGQEVRMRVHEAWKGVDGPEMILVAGLTSCDFNYRPGDRYVIYGSVGSDGVLRARYCGGSRLIEPGPESMEPPAPPQRTWPESSAG